MIKYNQFINENKYVTPEANIYDFLENVGVDANIIKEDNQTLIVEFMKNIDNKVEWWGDFIGLLAEHEYTKGVIDKNRYLSYKDFGIINVPDGYNSFSDGD